MNKRVLGTHGLMQQHPQERVAENLEAERARAELDRLNNYLLRKWSGRAKVLGLEGVDLAMAILEEYRYE